MREKEIEQKIVATVKKRGGICPKWVSPGKKARPLQRARHRQLRHLGFKVYVIDSEDQIDAVLDEIGGANEI